MRPQRQRDWQALLRKVWMRRPAWPLLLRQRHPQQPHQRLFWRKRWKKRHPHPRQLQRAWARQTAWTRQPQRLAWVHQTVKPQVALQRQTVSLVRLCPLAWELRRTHHQVLFQTVWFPLQA
jgi:hypothetical protein